MIKRIQTLLKRLKSEPSTDTERPVEPALPTVPEENDIAIARDLVTQELRRAEAAFTEHWEEEGDLTGSIDAIVKRHGFRTALTCLETVDPPDVVTFHVDSRVLVECYAELFADTETESLVYLTGMEMNPQRRTLNRFLPFSHTEQSARRAQGDPDAVLDTLVELDESGHSLLGHCHSHLGEGPDSARPSTVDRDHQARLEATGIDALGMIMTPDGYVRAFSNDFSFRIEVHGNHVTQEREKEKDGSLFRIEETARTAHHAQA